MATKIKDGPNKLHMATNLTKPNRPKIKYFSNHHMGIPSYSHLPPHTKNKLNMYA
jgi:hypothetical protein